MVYECLFVSNIAVLRLSLQSSVVGCQVRMVVSAVTPAWILSTAATTPPHRLELPTRVREDYTVPGEGPYQGILIVESAFYSNKRAFKHS